MMQARNAHSVLDRRRHGWHHDADGFEEAAAQAKARHTLHCELPTNPPVQVLERHVRLPRLLIRSPTLQSSSPQDSCKPSLPRPAPSMKSAYLPSCLQQVECVPALLPPAGRAHTFPPSPSKQSAYLPIFPSKQSACLPIFPRQAERVPALHPPASRARTCPPSPSRQSAYLHLLVYMLDWQGRPI